MDDIRETRPWFWILVAAISAVAIVALVIAISANNESIDQKKVVNEATAQIKDEVAGLNGAIEAANQFQEESDELAKQDQKRITRQVNKAVSGGETELRKLKSRVSSLESETTALAGEDEKLRKSVSNLSTGQEVLEAELAQLEKRVNRLEKQVE
jgi:chromosome segregation ATPase